MIHVHQKIKQRAQATTELALLLPILFFLLVMCVKIFQINAEKTQERGLDHAHKLEQFDAGNGLIYDGFSGDFLDAGQFNDLVPLGDAFNVGDMATQLVAQYGADFLLNELFSNLSFFGTGQILPAMTQAYVTSAVSSYVSSGFTEVDWEGAAWDSAVAGLSSQQASEVFQGENGNGGRELFGSGFQQASIGFAGSQGDGNAAAMGFVNGVFGSDTFGDWSSSEEIGNAGQMLIGAGRGAVTSATSGLLYGDFEWSNVAQSMGMGAIRTQAFADVVTGGTYDGNAMQSTMFGAVNGGLSAAISGGDFESSVYAAMDGAFYSGQIQGNFGDSRMARLGASFGYQAGKGLLKGDSIEAVGQGALAGTLAYAQSQAAGQVGQAFNDVTSTDQAEKVAGTISEEAIASSMDQLNEMLVQFGYSTNSGIFQGPYL